MADARINLLTSSSSTASDDFLVTDGTTNGTRKLNAFSPTFGGNMAVTGTLTSTGRLFASDNVQIAGSATWLNSGGGGTFNFVNGASTANTIRLGVGDANAVLVKSTGTEILATTASTTTSSGALVVGNGTSGGLGVGGAINAGGNIVLSPASATASGELGNLRIADSSNTNRKLFFGLDNTVSPNGVGYIQSTLTGTTTIPLQLQPLGGSLSVGNSGTVVTLNGTTASTNTSSGALVVSGGVGVAGAINAGGTLTVNGAGPHAFAGAITINPSSGDIQQNFQRSGTGKGILSVPGTAGNIVADSAVDDFVVRTTSGKAFRVTTDGGSTSALLVATGSTTFAGSVQTAAPSGGTAAAWKLGTVATVSPTSPNRTIEVDIGGTIYYIAAKTTNN